MGNVGAAEVEPALDQKVSFVLDLLRDEFTENDLFGEVFATNNDSVVMGAGGKRQGEYKARYCSEYFFYSCHSEPLGSRSNLLSL